MYLLLSRLAISRQLLDDCYSVYIVFTHMYSISMHTLNPCVPTHRPCPTGRSLRDMLLVDHMPLPLPSLPSKSHKTLFSISRKPSQPKSNNKHPISRKFTQISGETLDDSGVPSQNFMSCTALGRDCGQSSDVNRQPSVLLTRTKSPDVRSTAYPRARLLDRGLDAQDGELQAFPLSDEDAEALSPITFAPNPASSGSRWSIYKAITQEWYSPRSQIPPDFEVASFPQTPMPAISPSHKEWLRRRRSSSAGDLPAWSDDLDRMKEDLNNKEKAINVRRAQKMEKACLRPHSCDCTAFFINAFSSCSASLHRRPCIILVTRLHLRSCLGLISRGPSHQNHHSDLLVNPSTNKKFQTNQLKTRDPRRLIGPILRSPVQSFSQTMQTVTAMILFSGTHLCIITINILLNHLAISSTV